MNRFALLAGLVASSFFLVCGLAQEPAETEQRLAKIIIPEIEFTDATLEEAIEFLRRSAKEQDPDGAFNLIIKNKADGEDLKEVPLINLNLREVPLLDALRFTCDLAGHTFEITEQRIVIRSPVTLLTRDFNVPNNFIELSLPSEEAVDDPFGGDGGGGRTNCRLWSGNIVDLLQGYGVPFPTGASAIFDAAKCTLTVKNTQPNLDLIQVLTDSLWDLVPSSINLQVEVYTLSKLAALDILDGGEARLREKLRELLPLNRAELSDLLNVTAIDGEQAVTSSGVAIDYVAQFIDQDGKDSAVWESILQGTQLQTLTKLDPHSDELSVELTLTKSFGEVELVKAKVPAPVSGQLVEVSRASVPLAAVMTKTRLLNGSTRLVGTFSPEESDAKASKLCVVLLKASSKKLGKK